MRRRIWGLRSSAYLIHSVCQLLRRSNSTENLGFRPRHPFSALDVSAWRERAQALGVMRMGDLGLYRTPVDLGSPNFSSHVPPLLSNSERLFFDNEIGGPFGELLGLLGPGPVLIGLACRLSP